MEPLTLTYLKQHVSLSKLQETEITSLLHNRSLAKDSILLLREDDLISVTKGLLIKRHAETGQVQHFIAEQDIAIYPPLASSFILQAIEDSHIQYMRHSDVISLLQRHPNLQAPYYKMLRFWAFRRLQRASLLELPAGEAKKLFYIKFKHIATRIPSKDIASYLSIMPSYFSKL